MGDNINENTVNRELGQVIKYNAIETVLGKFFNIKTALYRKYRSDKTAGNVTLENPGSLMKLVKEYGHGIGVIDSRVQERDYEALLEIVQSDDKLYKIIKSLRIIADDITVEVLMDSALAEENGLAAGTMTAQDKNGDKGAVTVYVKQPRGTDYSFTAENTEGMSVMVQNCFTPYPNEGFTISFGAGKNYVSLCTEAQSGVKGAGTLYMYALIDGYVYRAEAVDGIAGAAGVLKMYRG